MRLVNGKDAILTTNWLGNDVVLGCARSINFEMQTDMIETSITGSGNFRTFIPGASSFTGSMDGLVLLTGGPHTNIGMGELYEFFLANTPFEVSYYEEDVEGANFLNKDCTIYIDTISESASFDNMVTFSCTFKGVGAPTITYGTI